MWRSRCDMSAPGLIPKLLPILRSDVLAANSVSILERWRCEQVRQGLPVFGGERPGNETSVARIRTHLTAVREACS